LRRNTIAVDWLVRDAEDGADFEISGIGEVIGVVGREE
jgi:hypothetical protein